MAYQSEHLLKLEQEEKQKLEDKLRLQEEKQRKYIEDLERPPKDQYHGHRIHAWIVILPELGGLRDQEISCPLFIEPTTGVSYDATTGYTAQLYLGIESIWNDQNYWVNMQSSKSSADIKWDLTKVEQWEHLLPGEPWTMRGTGEEIDLESIVPQEKHLDMPFSYVNKITISEQKFEKRYPNGSKTILYKKAKVELYAPHIQTDGLIQKLTFYDDMYVTPVEVYEYYQNRSDNLVESRKNLTDDAVVDYYSRGRIDYCREHRYFGNDSNAVDNERILDFYYTGRLDGLSRIEMHPEYLTQQFVDRDDFLFYRHVQFSQGKNNSALDDIHYRQILKIVEKFNRDENIKANQNIAIREFAIDDNEIRLTYHYNPGLFSRATRIFIKPPLAERGERLALNSSMTQGYNPLDEPVKGLEVFYELETQLREEDLSISHVRNAEVEVSTFLVTRNSEYLTPTLLISTYDKHRDVKSATDILMSEWTREQSVKDLVEDKDYLKPYLARIGNPTEVSVLQAYSIKHDCLNDYKQLLVSRANTILYKFEEYMQSLEELQTSLVQNEDLSHEEEAEILEKMDKINFILQTLETRLDRHRDLVPERYKMLMDYLQETPHLTVLRS